MINDVAQEQKVVDNIEVAGKPAIEIKPEYIVKVATSIFKTLPTTGLLTKGEIYSYNNGAVMVVQDHSRTTFAPELTPALFSFYREVTEGKEWIVGEKIELNATSPAAYSVSPLASSFQTITIAIHLASPMMIRPTMYSG